MTSVKFLLLLLLLLPFASSLVVFTELALFVTVFAGLLAELFEVVLLDEYRVVFEIVALGAAVFIVVVLVVLRVVTPLALEGGGFSEDEVLETFEGSAALEGRAIVPKVPISFLASVTTAFVGVWLGAEHEGTDVLAAAHGKQAPLSR